MDCDPCGPGRTSRERYGQSWTGQSDYDEPERALELNRGLQ